MAQGCLPNTCIAVTLCLLFESSATKTEVLQAEFLCRKDCAVSCTHRLDFTYVPSVNPSNNPSHLSEKIVSKYDEDID